MHDDEQDYAGPSRSAKKRAAKAVEELALEILELSPAQLEKLPVPDQILGELRKARQIKAHGARKRQAKFLAGLLRRDEDVLEALRQHMEALNQVHYQDQQVFHELESLRDRLCDAGQYRAALQEVSDRYPALDQDLIARLAVQAQAGKDKRAYREIFKRLRQAREQGE
ncbi:DUF615 domain-containing protein [Desulfuromonas sp. KJ2020]|uniref:ribosome biogenesis factor YjgA n=1 Tax=Desulfuromonas sp. KJ2020 TaxID=2919173 RepID=UPI0003236037|nr:ribosome biogenesis factor YjgA [Desulfuromonas sp. KJ2020]MCP3176449.1 DUF615 domain-containing protein [Desulfuromonas sp. KJ2020]